LELAGLGEEGFHPRVTERKRKNEEKRFKAEKEKRWRRGCCEPHDDKKRGAQQ
jgi:hypothetical protein